MLLEREDVTAVDAVERLVGMQAQVARPPFIGLWTRLRTFDRAQLAAALHERAVVRVTAMRGTLHLMTTADYAAMRGVLHPMLTRGALPIRSPRWSACDPSLALGSWPADTHITRAHRLQRVFR